MRGPVVCHMLFFFGSASHVFVLPIIVYIHRITSNTRHDFAMPSRCEVVVRYSQDPLRCLDRVLSNSCVRSAAWTVHGKVAVHLVDETF